MLRSFPHRWLMAVGLFALALGAGGAAWGCVPQPLIALQPRSSGPGGSEVTVDAVALDPALVEIRWNGLDGELLARASGPQFSVPVTIPEVPEGLYTIVVFARDATGAVGSSGRAAFLVTSSSGSSPNEGSPTSTLSTPSPPPSSPSPPPSSDVGSLALLGTGLGVAVAGGLIGAAVARRRSPEST